MHLTLYESTSIMRKSLLESVDYEGFCAFHIDLDNGGRWNHTLLDQLIAPNSFHFEISRIFGNRATTEPCRVGGRIV